MGSSRLVMRGQRAIHSAASDAAMRLSRPGTPLPHLLLTSFSQHPRVQVLRGRRLRLVPPSPRLASCPRLLARRPPGPVPLIRSLSLSLSLSLSRSCNCQSMGPILTTSRGILSCTVMPGAASMLPNTTHTRAHVCVSACLHGCMGVCPCVYVCMRATCVWEPACMCVCVCV